MRTCLLCYDKIITGVLTSDCNIDHTLCINCYFKLNKKSCPICFNNYNNSCIEYHDESLKRRTKEYIFKYKSLMLYLETLLQVISIDDLLSKLIIQIVSTLLENNLLIKNDLYYQLIELKNTINNSHIDNKLKKIYKNDIFVLCRKIKPYNLQIITNLKYFKNILYSTIIFIFTLTFYILFYNPISFICCYNTYSPRCNEYMHIIEYGRCIQIVHDFEIFGFLCFSTMLISTIYFIYNIYLILCILRNNKKLLLIDRLSYDLDGIPFTNTVTNQTNTIIL